MCRELRLPLFPSFTDRAKETLLHYAGRVMSATEKHGRTLTFSVSPAAVNILWMKIVIDPFQRHPAVDAAAPALPAASVTPDLPLKLREFQLQRKSAAAA